jgi:hypothetical protein
MIAATDFAYLCFAKSRAPELPVRRRSLEPTSAYVPFQ